jgi:D,D-heptose 1,7-bisphosphate phosphatase
MAEKAVFLDRDDTLIEDPGYISDPSQVKLLPGVANSLIDLKDMGYKLIVVSNQSAVARGIVTEDVLEKIHAKLKGLLSRKGAYFDGLYYCPYHPEGSIPKYRKDSDMRKPNPGMLLKAAEDMDIDLGSSWMIGDKYDDVAAGKRAGCRTVLINSSIKPAVKVKKDPDPDHKAVNIVEAVNIIKMFDRQSHVSVEAVRAQTDAGLRDEPVEIPAVQEQVETEEPPEMPVQQEEPAIDAAEENAAVDKFRSEQAEQVIEQPAAEEKISPPPSIDPSEFVDGKVTENFHGTVHEKTHHLLEEILFTARKVQRHTMFSESTIAWTLALAVQIVVVGLLILSVVFMLAPEKSQASVYMVMGYTVIAQLIVIALCLMERRK